jgi:hypothetical protein
MGAVYGIGQDVVPPPLAPTAKFQLLLAPVLPKANVKINCSLIWSGYTCTVCSSSCEYSSYNDCIDACESDTPLPIATPVPLPTTNWNLLYNTIQTSNGMFDLSTTLTMGGIISPLLRIIFPIAGLILLLMLIYGGYNWMLSGGDPKKAAAAKGIITMALVGFAIIFTAYWLVQIIGSILGLGAITTIF